VNVLVKEKKSAKAMVGYEMDLAIKNALILKSLNKKKAAKPSFFR
jgi:hypothetical protein